jgi:hypothetical protein
VLRVKEGIQRNIMNKSNYLCPICNVHLNVQDMMNGSIAAWCGYMHCPSRAANEGAESVSEEGAYLKLERMVEVEVNQNNQHGAMCGCACCMDKQLEAY